MLASSSLSDCLKGPYATAGGTWDSSPLVPMGQGKKGSDWLLWATSSFLEMITLLAA